MAARGRKRQIEQRTPPGPKPEPPSWLDDAGRELWSEYSDTVNSLGLLEKLDAISFALLCGSIATLQDMQKQFSCDGEYTNTVGENGAMQVNPLCQLIAQQTKGVLTLAAEFGMTPRGRVNLTGSLSCNPDAGAVNPMEALLAEVTGSNAAQSGGPAVTHKTAAKAARKKSAAKKAATKKRKARKPKPPG